MPVAVQPNVMTVADLPLQAITRLLDRYGITVMLAADDAALPGSFWGAPEAGILGMEIHVRRDTPIHSLLHESSHIVCMAPALRRQNSGDAGSDDIEEAAVCYLQILLADSLAGVGRDRLMRDMDAWGYSFRLGSTRRWFEEDAADARAWLKQYRLIEHDDRPGWRLRAGSTGPR